MAVPVEARVIADGTGPGAAEGSSWAPTYVLPLVEYDMGAKLVALAVARAALNPRSGMPRYVAAVSDDNYLHVLGPSGRALLPAPLDLSLATGTSTPASALVFTLKEPHFLVGAVDHANGLRLCYWRLSSEGREKGAPPQLSATLIKQTETVSWTLDAGAGGREGEGRRRRGAGGAAEASEARGGVVALEALPLRSGSHPSIAAARADGQMLFFSQAGTPLLALDTGVDRLHTVIRSTAHSLTLIGDRRISVLAEPTRRAPTRECAVPDAAFNGGARLVGGAHDSVAPTLLYALTSTSEVIVFNTRTRHHDDELVSVQCMWTDTLPPPARAVTSMPSIVPFKGYVLTASAGALRALNVTALHSGVHHAPSVPIAAPGFGPLAADDAEGPAGSEAALRMWSGGALLALSRGDALSLHAVRLPYAEQSVSLWPRVLLGVAVLVITVVYQLYRRRSKRGARDAPEYESRDGYGWRERLAGASQARHGGRAEPGSRARYGAARNPVDDFALPSQAKGQARAHERAYANTGGGFGGGATTCGGSTGGPSSSTNYVDLSEVRRRIDASDSDE